MPMIFWAMLAGALLFAEHMAFRDRRWRLTRPQAYTVGTATLGLCHTGWAMTTNHADAAISFWVIAAVGGAVVVASYWVEARLAEARQEAQMSGITAETARGVAEDELNAGQQHPDPGA